MPDIRIAPFAEHHRPGFRALLMDPEVLRRTRIPVPVPDGFDEIWVTSYEQRRAAGTAMNFAIEDGATGAFLGVTMAATIERAARTAELGYLVAPEVRGRGVATAALEQLTGWAFGEGLHRLYLLISVDNDPSKRVAKRAGYRFEGVLRGVHLKQDEFADTESWSRLATD